MINTKTLGLGAVTVSAFSAAFAAGAQANVAGDYCGSPGAEKAFPPTCVHTPYHYSYTSLQGLFTTVGAANSAGPFGCVGLTQASHPVFSQVYAYECAIGAKTVKDNIQAFPSYERSGYAIVFRGGNAQTGTIHGHGYLNALR